MSLWVYILVFLFTLVVGIYVLSPRFFLAGIREVVLGTGVRITVPVLSALAVMAVTPLPPVIGGFVYFLLRPKRENITRLVQVVRTGNVEQLGKEWYDLYTRTVSSGGVPPGSSRILAQKYRVTYIVVTTLARTRSPEVLDILRAVLQSAAQWSARVQEQSTSLILTPVVVLIGSSLLWYFLQSRIGPIPVWQELYQVGTVAVFCLICELVQKTLSV